MNARRGAGKGLGELLVRLGGRERDLIRGTPRALFVNIPSWLDDRNRHPENCEAPLDLGYAAALVERDGTPTAILDLETGLFRTEEVVEAIRADRPAVLVMRGITPATGAMLALARRTRAVSPETLVVACGQQADAVPEAFLFDGSPVDSCVAGELEETVAEIVRDVDAARSGRVPGTRRFADGRIVAGGDRALIADLDALPRPLHRFFLNPHYRYLHPMRRVGPYRWGFVQAKRGCPFSCVYCSASLRTSYGSRIRARSPESVVAEMRDLERRGVNVLVFTDDLFNSGREAVLELCERICSSGVRISWLAKGRVTPVDSEMFRAMRRAGCSTFCMGIESGSQRILDSMKKKTRVEEIERAFRLAGEAGLLKVGYFMVGAPGEEESDFQASLRLLERVDPDIIQVAYFTCYPGSPAYEQHGGKEIGDWSEFRHYENFVNLSAESDESVRRWQKTLYKRFLFRPRYVLRYLTMKHVNLLINLRSEWFLVEQALRSLLVKNRE